MDTKITRKRKTSGMDVLNVGESGPLNPKFYLYYNGKLLVHTDKRSRIYHFNMSKYPEITLKVVYKRGVENSGTFTTKKELSEALKGWVEPELLHFIYTSNFID